MCTKLGYRGYVATTQDLFLYQYLAEKFYNTTMCKVI